jgi:hypothetical protein
MVHKIICKKSIYGIIDIPPGDRRMIQLSPEEEIYSLRAENARLRRDIEKLRLKLGKPLVIDGSDMGILNRARLDAYGISY